MWSREDWGLRLFLTGMGLGFALMFFVVTLNGTSFYQNLVAPTTTEVMRPLGYVLDGGILLSFAMTIAGIACFSGAPSRVETPQPRPAGRPSTPRRRKDRRPAKASAPHGST